MQQTDEHVCHESDVTVAQLAGIGEQVTIYVSKTTITVGWVHEGEPFSTAGRTLTDAAFLALACAEALQNRAACEAL